MGRQKNMAAHIMLREKYHQAPEEHRLPQICRTYAFTGPVILYWQLTPTQTTHLSTVLSVFTNQKFPTNFLWSKWLRKKIPSIIITVVLGFGAKPSIAILCFISPKKNDLQCIVRNTQIYRSLSIHCKGKRNIVKGIQWTFKKKVVNWTFKL